MFSSALVRQLVYEKDNSEFKPVKLCLKIDLVSYPARAEGVGKYDKAKKTNLDFYFNFPASEAHTKVKRV